MSACPALSFDSGVSVTCNPRYGTSSFAEYRVLAQSVIGCRPAEYAGAQVPCHYNAIARAFGSPILCVDTTLIDDAMSGGREGEGG